MRAVIQRVAKSRVTVDGRTSGEIQRGLMILIGVEDGDTEKDAAYIASKTSGLRIFEDENNKMNLSVKDVDGDILAMCEKESAPAFLRQPGRKKPIASIRR